MALVPGSRIGAYEVLSLIGEGGMGEVYRARDLTLDRDVAIKRLPDALANDPERLARFEREARTLASLNHPNVAQIYAVESGSIVMELVPGKTLSGPLPLETALDYAAQIASALDAAHERGIVHRDLKPGNVVVTPEGVVKVLDFGLAARETHAADQDPSRSPTITAMSQQGMIIGTAAYMAPEQAAGKPVDKRADIFAFGVVLWELLTGARMFDGETTSHVLAAVLTKEPDLGVVPPRVRYLLARCLEKDPKKRLRDIGDAMSLVTQDAVAATSAPPLPLRVLTAGGWVAAVAIAAVALMAWPRSTTPVDSAAPIVRYSIPRTLDLYNQNSTAFSVSPDGSQLAYHNETADGQYSLYVRNMATGDTRELSAALRTFGPRSDSIVWSPDGRRMVRGMQLAAQLIDLESGAARTLCDCRFTGGAWAAGDDVLLGGQGAGQGIIRIKVNDPNPVKLTSPDAALGEQDRWPVLLPDGRRFLFSRRSNDGEVAYVGSLDGTEPRRIGDGSPRVIVPAAGRGGAYLIGIDETGATARAFDLETLTVSGPPITLLAGAVAVSGGTNGILVLSEPGARQRSVPTWYDRKGQSLGQATTPGYIEAVALSDDGRFIATAESPDGRSVGTHDLWIHDTAKSVKTRLTFSPDNDSTAEWTPDGRRIIYTSRPKGDALLFQKNADGTGSESLVFDDDRSETYANDVSPDGRWLLYASRREGNVTDLFVRPIVNGVAGKPALYLGGPRRQQQGEFSPDGRYVAYGDDRTGTFDIYVQPFPDASTGKWMVSSGGGTEPRWSRDGKELFYLAGQALMSVPVTLSPTFSFGPAVKLFDTPVQAGYTNESDIWQVAPDGKRFLMLPADDGQSGPELRVIVNWQALLKQ
ncbi:MAG TPA: protein kinase [Vicinamibacterales bacterium]|nr:protein kinase [Vicinamibacterales bacterium]